MDVTLSKIQRQAATLALRVTQHAQIEMDAEEITLDEVLMVITRGQILEDYPDHRRGQCCLLLRYTSQYRLNGLVRHRGG